ncbi:multidrug efflux MFS transporter [Candidatus Roizmanbacteria bacterium]|nr:multidrug efflux MFS transporter [Candidatus Roizmanbacteria bacterium]
MATKSGFTGNQWMIMLTLMIASFLGRLDGTIVSLALPKIISDFGITLSSAAWISTAYIIANAIFVPIFGKLGDLIGRKPLYIFGIVGFTLTSALAGLAFNLPSMVFFRVLQAITVSIDYPLALSIIAVTFEDKDQRTQAMGLWSAIFAAAAVFGPLLGGPLIDNFSWRSVFYINIPLGIIATFLSLKYIVEPVKEKKGIHNFDIAGSLLLGTFLGVLVLVLDQGQTWGWFSMKSLACYAISTVSLAVFLIVEKKAKEPIIDLKFFKNSTFTASIVNSFVSFMGLMGGLFLIPVFVQQFLGYSVTKAGYVFIPMAMCLMVAAQVGARLIQKFPARYVISGGMLIAAFGLNLFAAIDIKWTFWDISYRLGIMAFGVGMGLAPLTRAATATVPVQEVGIASSILALARNIAGAFGTAIFATILSNSITDNLLNVQRYSVVHATNAAVVQEYMFLMASKAEILAYSTVFHVTVYVMILGAITALFIKSGKSSGEQTSEPIEL